MNNIQFPQANRVEYFLRKAGFTNLAHTNMLRNQKENNNNNNNMLHCKRGTSMQNIPHKKLRKNNPLYRDNTKVNRSEHY